MTIGAISSVQQTMNSIYIGTVRTKTDTIAQYPNWYG